MIIVSQFITTYLTALQGIDAHVFPILLRNKLRLREAELREHPCGSELTAVSQAPAACHTAQYLGTWPHWDAGDERMEEWNVGASETPS